MEQLSFLERVIVVWILYHIRWIFWWRTYKLRYQQSAPHCYLCPVRSPVGRSPRLKRWPGWPWTIYRILKCVSWWVLHNEYKAVDWSLQNYPPQQKGSDKLIRGSLNVLTYVILWHKWRWWLHVGCHQRIAIRKGQGGVGRVLKASMGREDIK